METTSATGSPKKKKRLGPVNLAVIAEIRRQVQDAMNTAVKLEEKMISEGYAGTFEFDGGSAGVAFAASLNAWLGRAAGLYGAIPLAERTGKKKPRAKGT